MSAIIPSAEITASLLLEVRLSTMVLYELDDHKHRIVECIFQLTSIVITQHFSFNARSHIQRLRARLEALLAHVEEARQTEQAAIAYMADSKDDRASSASALTL